MHEMPALPCARDDRVSCSAHLLISSRGLTTADLLASKWLSIRPRELHEEQTTVMDLTHQLELQQSAQTASPA